MSGNRGAGLLAMSQTAMLTAMLAVLAQLTIPMPSSVPLTLQTFGAALCAWLGGSRRGVPAVLLYLACGAVGMPVFAGMRSGFSVLLGLTGGFLWGFVPLALCCALAAEPPRKLLAVPAGTAGLLCCHLLGTAQYALTAGMGFAESFLLVSLPYLLKDALSIGAAYFAARAIRRALGAAGIHLS